MAAQAAHREVRLHEAERVYRSILDGDPGIGDALHFLGVLLHQRGDQSRPRDMARRNTWQWAIIVSADTLCYFGDLAPVVSSASRALRADGLFLFTLEALAPESSAGFELRAGGRYAHSRRGVEQTLRVAGFASVGIDAGTLRLEAGLPVQGWVVCARHLP